MTTTDTTSRILELAAAARTATTDPLKERVDELLTARDDLLDRFEQFAALVEPTLAEYLRSLWPAAAAVHVDSNHQPTRIVDGDGHTLAAVADLGEPLAAPIRKLISLLDPDDLERHRLYCAAAYAIALPDTAAAEDTDGADPFHVDFDVDADFGDPVLPDTGVAAETPGSPT